MELIEYLAYLDICARVFTWKGISTRKIRGKGGGGGRKLREKARTIIIIYLYWINQNDKREEWEDWKGINVSYLCKFENKTRELSLLFNSGMLCDYI
jgi:hypothetical protein